MPFLFFILSLLLLFPAFFRNQWRAARPGKFHNFQRDSEILVVGRLVESRQHGIFSASGFLGAGDVEQHSVAKEEIFFDHQYAVYFGGGTFDTFSRYRSQSGGQGWFFSLLDMLSPATPMANMRVYYGLTALWLAAMIALLATWAGLELGWLAGIALLAGALASPWLTVYGRNLFYVAGFHYLPMVALTFLVAREAGNGEVHPWRMLGLVFATVALKCLFNGFDFILPSLAMLAAPLTYYAVRDRWHRTRVVRSGAAVLGGAALAVALALVVLFVQNASELGDPAKAAQYIAGRFLTRAAPGQAPLPEDDPARQATTWEILKPYFVGNTAIGQTGIRFVDLIVVFGAVTVVSWQLERRRSSGEEERSRGRALVVMTWSSILSPLAWYVIFRGQAFYHTHTNFLAWYMPFVLLGFALCGYVAKTAALAVRGPGPMR